MWRGISALALALLLSLGVAPTTPAHAGEPWVVKAQKRLNELGCNSGPVDGVMGDWTRSAIVRFQSRHELPMTGRLSDATKKKLYSDTASRCDVRPVPGKSGSGRRIVLSQRQNWVWLVGKAGKIVAQSPMVDNPGELGTGKTTVASYCGRPAKVEKNITESGELYMDNFTRFSPCGIGFHRIPTYVSNGAQIHPNWLLGTNFRESHGCIRLTNAFSERLWDFGTVGTPVHVVWG